MVLAGCLVAGVWTSDCGGGAASTGHVEAGDGGTTVGPNVDSQLSINELMSLNALTIKDEHGTTSAWFEIYNPTGQDIALSNYAVTDDFNTPRKAVLPSGVSVPAGGYLLLWADGNPSAGAAHVDVFLPGGGGSLGLARPDGSFIDRLTYGAQETDLSAAREPDGSNNWVTEWNVSPGAANPMGSGQPRPMQAASDPPETIAPAGDLTDRVLGYDLLPTFDLQISSDGINSLRSAPSTWVQATLTFEGRRVRSCRGEPQGDLVVSTDRPEARLPGETSRSSSKGRGSSVSRRSCSTTWCRTPRCFTSGWPTGSGARSARSPPHARTTPG